MHPFTIPFVHIAHEVLSLELPMESHWALQAFLWIFFPLVLVLFSVGFVQLVSIHAIGKLMDNKNVMYYLPSSLSLSHTHTHTHTHTISQVLASQK